jgi:hypothetical protein
MPLRFLPTLLVASLLLAGCPSEVPVASCTPGTSGCSCQAGAQPCLTVDLLCSNGRCVECVLGSQGCGCADGESCVTPGLVCEDGRCVSYAKAPETPVCYTPCLQDLVREDGTVATCSAEGLLEGCVGDLQCLKGSCAKADATKPPLRQRLGLPRLPDLRRRELLLHLRLGRGVRAGLVLLPQGLPQALQHHRRALRRQGPRLRRL